MAVAVGGTLFFKVNGEAYQVKGNWTYNTGQPKREAIVGMDSVHGYKETPQAPKLSGQITDKPGQSTDSLKNVTDGDLMLEMANGKVFALRNSFYVADGDITTEEGEVQVEFQGLSADIIEP